MLKVALDVLKDHRGNNEGNDTGWASSSFYSEACKKVWQSVFYVSDAPSHTSINIIVSL